MSQTAELTQFHRSNETEGYYYNQLLAIISNNSTSNCTKCLGETDVLHQAAVSQTVSTFTDLLIKYCRPIAFQQLILLTNIARYCSQVPNLCRLL